MTIKHESAIRFHWCQAANMNSDGGPIYEKCAVLRL